MRGKTGATKAEILRVLHGLNKTGLAAKAKIGSHTITTIEEGKPCHYITAAYLSNVLGCEIEELQQIVTPEQFIEMSRAYEANANTEND